MKARLPQRKTDKPTILFVRDMMTMVGDLALIEEFGFGTERLYRFHARLSSLASHYDRAYQGDLHRLMFDIHKVVRSVGVEYGRRDGYSKRTDLALEHDMILSYILLTLHETFGFGAHRLSRIWHRMEERIVYQNGVFGKEFRDAEFALRSKLCGYLGPSYVTLRWEAA